MLSCLFIINFIYFMNTTIFVIVLQNEHTKKRMQLKFYFNLKRVFLKKENFLTKLFVVFDVFNKQTENLLLLKHLFLLKRF